MNKLVIFVYLYLTVGIIAMTEIIKLPGRVQNIYIGLIIFILFKWLFNYRKCTISYIEYRLRNSKKEDCYLYRFMENLIDLRYTRHVRKYTLLAIIILFDFYFIKKKEIKL